MLTYGVAGSLGSSRSKAGTMTVLGYSVGSLPLSGSCSCDVSVSILGESLSVILHSPVVVSWVR